MKKQIPLSLFLLTFFLAANVVAQKNVRQQKNVDKPVLRTEFVRLISLEVKYDENNLQGLSKEGVYLLEIIKPLLSRQGSVDIAVKEKTLIVTDTKGRAKLVAELVKTLDNSNLSIDYLMSEALEENENTITETVQANYIFPIITCLTGVDSPGMALQGYLLYKPMKKIKVHFRPSFKEKEGKITGTGKRVELAKKIIALFDQPFLTEEEDYDF